MGRKNRLYKRDKSYLFVDGYNIINQWQDLADLVDTDLELAREKLVESLIEYAHIANIELILVFDAYRVRGNEGSWIKKEGIEIIYTKEGETADHYIERQLHHIGRVREVTVATSDYIEQQLILARGGRRISARELEVMVQNARSLTRMEAKRIQKESKNIKNTLDQESLRDLEAMKKKLK